MSENGVKTETKRCGKCHRDLSTNNFYPSTVKVNNAPCKNCVEETNRKRRADVLKKEAGQLYAIFGEREWASIEASEKLNWTRKGIGAKLHSMVQHGLIVYMGKGRYRLPKAAAFAAPTPQPAQLPLEAVPTPAPVEAPAAAKAVPGLFLEAGPYLFGMLNIAWIEQDDRGRTLVGLNVQETRPTGHIAPVTFEFTGAEARQIIDGVSIVRGEPSSEVKDYIRQLEERLAKSDSEQKRIEQDRDAAVALATELETKLGNMRKMLAG